MIYHHTHNAPALRQNIWNAWYALGRLHIHSPQKHRAVMSHSKHYANQTMEVLMVKTLDWHSGHLVDPAPSANVDALWDLAQDSNPCFSSKKQWQNDVGFFPPKYVFLSKWFMEMYRLKCSQCEGKKGAHTQEEQFLVLLHGQPLPSSRPHYWLERLLTD